ncbi:MAG: 4-hydroxythreonine-4-phosphate dehydrogenase PdxA, partial [Desulfovibrionaceae bacterium]
MKTVLITLGDPSGLGPELVVRLFGRAAPADCRVLLLGPEAAMRESCSCGSVASFWKRLDDPAEARGQGPGVYLYEPPELAGVRTVPGKPSEAGGLCAGVCLEAAVALLRAGVGHGLCTCPLNKATLQAAGFDFPGHTEFLAERLGVGRDGVCMHLGGTRLRVSLVTTHPPLAEVPRLVTRERILRCLELTAAYLDSIGVAGPIGVCG